MHEPHPTSVRPTVVVLMGGPDAERPVSLMSGAQVTAALRACGRFDVRDVVVDRPGVTELAAIGGDVVFPALHGRWGEGGPLQELLEAIGVPYVGSGPRAAALAMDKLAAKDLLSARGIPTPEGGSLRPDEPCGLAPPVVLKPIDDGSSVDLEVCRTPAALADARSRLHPRRGRLMVERFVEGRELTVGILLDEALPVLEIVPADGLYDYAAKYEREDTGYRIDPPLPEGVAEACRATALHAYRLVGCRDVARVDFILEGTTPWFLEINTMPGFTSHSLVPMAAAHVGLPMPEVCGRMVDAALARRAVHTAPAILSARGPS